MVKVTEMVIFAEFFQDILILFLAENFRRVLQCISRMNRVALSEADTSSFSKVMVDWSGYHSNLTNPP